MSKNNFLPKLVIFSALALVLGACNSVTRNVDDTLDLSANKEQAAPENDAQDLRAYCPKTVLRAGTETYRLFKKGVSKGDPGARKSLRFQGSITEVVRECNYRGNRLNIRVGIAGRIINGPSNETGTIKMPVRVAVTRGDDVLYTVLHRVNGTIDEGKANGFFKFVDGNVTIAKPSKENIVIYVGFDEGPNGG